MNAKIFHLVILIICMSAIPGFCFRNSGPKPSQHAIFNQSNEIIAQKALVEKNGLNQSSIKTTNKRVLSAPINFPPFMFLNSEGRVAGMFVDIWRLWAKKTGQKIEFLPAATWKESLENIKNGRADIHPGLFYDPEQYEGMRFSQVFYECGVGLLFPVKQGAPLKVRELSGQTIGAIRGSSSVSSLKKINPDIRIAAFDTRKEMIYATRDGEARAFISAIVLGDFYISHLGLSGEFECGDEILYTGKLCAGVAEENIEILKLVDKGFDAITNTELADIEKRWIPDPAKRFFNRAMNKVRLTQAEHAWLKTVKTVRFGFIDGLPPFTFIEDGEFKGLHTDYLRLIEERTGIRFEYVPVAPNKVDLKAQNREIDMFPTLTIPERKKYANFTIALMEYPFGIITRNDIPFISDISMLSGKKIAVIKGIKFYQHLFEAYPEIEWIEKNNMLEALEAVSKSEADGYVGSSLITSWLIQKHHLVNLRVTGMLDSISDQLMYAIRNDCPELLGIINKGVASITKEERNAILRKWFKVTIEYAPNWSEYTEWLIWIAGIIVAIIGITLYWNTRMGMEVSIRKKTEELLRESNAKNKAILSAIPDMMVIQNKDGVFLEWHASSESDFYVPPSEFIGKTPAEVLPKELADLNLNSVRKVFRTGKECIVEYPLQIEDRLHFFESRMVSCTPETVLCIIRNITDRKRVEEALKVSEAALLEAQAVAKIGSWQYDVAKDKTVWSKEMFRIFDRDPDLGEPCWADHRRHIHAEDWERVDRVRKKALQKGIPYRKEFRIVHQDETTVWVETIGYIRRNESGEVVKLSGTVQDISDRKQAEKDMRESRELYRKMVENNHDALFTMDAQGLFRYISPVIERKFGFRPKEVIGKKFAEFIHPEDLHLAFDQFQKLLSGKEVTGQYRVIHKSGEIGWIRTSSQPTFTGDALTIQGVIADITAQKIAEDKIRKILNEQKIILDNAMVGIVFVKDRKIVRANKFVEKFSGLSMKELAGQSTEVMYPSKESYEELGRKAYPVLSRGEVFEIDWILKQKDNTPFWCNLVGAAINSGNPDEGAIWILQDIDKKKQIEEELRKAKEAAESANNAKSVFLASMSHELRTPLNSILGYAQILKNDSGLTGDQRKGLGTIEQSGNHLLSLLNDILDIAKIESGKVELYETDFHFLDFIRNVCDLIKVRAKQKGLHFHLEINSKLKKDHFPEYVHADQRCLRQVLVNLLGNAVKFTDNGAITLRIRAKRDEIQRDGAAGSSAPNFQWFAFEIEDTGIGVAPENLNKIFEPFEQNGDPKHQAKGTGLGLSISRNLINLMGGELRVKSQLGSGSIFYFDLALPEVRSARKKQTVKRKIIGLKGKAPKVLVVDDNKLNRSVLLELLASMGFRLAEAADGREGLEMAEKIRPDLIITDLVMPGMDGFELIRRIRQSPLLKDTLVFAFSASVYNEVQKSSYNAGADAFIPKPIKANAIFEPLARFRNIEWIYAGVDEKEEGEDPDARIWDQTTDEHALTPDRLAKLPREWLRDLHKATIIADPTMVENMIEQIRTKDRLLADALAQLADEFRFDVFQKLLEEMQALEISKNNETSRKGNG